MGRTLWGGSIWTETWRRSREQTGGLSEGRVPGRRNGKSKSPEEGHIAGCSKKARAAKAAWVRGAVGSDFRDGRWPACRALAIRRTWDFILWKMGSCWSAARANYFKAVWLSLRFLKMLQFSVSFRIKFKWFILAHKVFIVRPQPIYLASSASFPHGPFTLAKLDYVQFPG